MNKVKFDRVELEEGPLYPVMGEDEMQFFFYYSLAAFIGGKKYIHSSWAVSGEKYGYNVRNVAEAYLSKVQSAGAIDLQHWVLAQEEPSLQERFDQYAREEQAEREGCNYQFA